MADPPTKGTPSPSTPKAASTAKNVVVEDLETDLSADELEEVGQTGSKGTPLDQKRLTPPTKPPPRTRPPTVPPPKPIGNASGSQSIPGANTSASQSLTNPNASASISASTSGAAPRPGAKPSIPPAAPKPTKSAAPPKVEARSTPAPIARPSVPEGRRTVPYEHPVSKVELNIPVAASPPAFGPSESMTAAAERPLATQPGAASVQVQRARAAATEAAAQLAFVRAAKRTSDKPRIARLLVEQGLAFERAGDLPAAGKAFAEALDLGAGLLSAARAARRVTRVAPLTSRLALLDKEAAITSKESDRADLHVERARLLETDKRDDIDAIIKAYEQALALRPSHAEALKGLESALLRARARATADAAQKLDDHLAEHCGRLAAAYGSDPELVASYLATRARILEERGDAVAAEEAWAASLIADGRVGPVRESYKRHLGRRKAWVKLRDAIAEEAGREHDLARSVRLLHEAARISFERLNDVPQAITLLEHAASRSPTDPSADARVLEDLVRLLDTRGDPHGAALARRSLLVYDEEPALRAVGFRKLAADFEAIAEHDAAIAAYETARTIEPLHAATQHALERLYLSRGRHHDRVALWLDEAARAREPERRAAAYVRAAHVAEDSLGRPEDALEYLRAAWVTDTGNVDALDELTRLLLPPTEMRHGVGGGEGRNARALIELFHQAAQVSKEPARKIAFLEKIAALWEDALGNPGEAAKVYERVLALDSTRRFALLGMQRALERAGDFRALAVAIEIEADQATDTEHAVTLRLRAAETWRARAADAERAVALIRRVLEDRPDEKRALRALLEAQEAAGRWDEVARTLDRTIQASKGGETLPLWLELAEVRRKRLGQIDEAITAWRRALEVDPTNVVATRELAHALRTKGDWRAVADLEEKTATAAKDARVASRSWVRAAEVWEGRLDSDDRAQEAYARALTARPDDLAAWDGLARIAERRNAHKDLEAAYRLRIEREEADGHPRTPLRIALGELLARRGDDPRAAAIALDAVISENPAHMSSLRLLEAIHRRTGNDVQLAKILTAMAQTIRDPLAKRGILWELVRLQERTDEGVAASPPIAAYLLIYELDPSDEAALAAIVRLAMDRLREGQHSADGMPNVRGLLAFALRKQMQLATDEAVRGSLALRLADLLEDSIERKEQAEALALYREALVREPESPTAIAGLSRVASNLGDLPAQLLAETSAAEISLDRAAKIAHLLRAATLAPRVPEAGESVALDLVIRALREDPDSAEAAAAVSALLLARDDTRRLVDLLMEAANAAKRTERIVALAREGAHHAASALDNIPVAIALLTRAREADPRDAMLLIELGDLYVQQRAWAEAAKAYGEGVSHAREDAIHPLLVRGHRALAALYEGPLEDPQRALDELKIVCRLAPEDVDAQRRLATALSTRGDTEGALKALETLATTPGLPSSEHVAVLAQIADLRLSAGDTRGSESALRRAVRLEPDPTGLAFGRFATFHQRHGGDAALGKALSEMVIEAGADPRWLRHLGDLEIHRIGRPNEGLAHLRDAVRAAEAGRGEWIPAQLSLSEALLAVGAAEEAAKAVRELLQRDPTNAAGLDAAHRALTALGRRDEVLTVDELRAYLGYEGSALTYRARRVPPTPPREQALEDVAIHAHVMPPAAKTVGYEIIHALSDQLGKVYPPELPTPREKLGTRSSHAVRILADRAARALGVTEFELYLHDAPDQRIAVENTEPPSLIVPRTIEALPELEISFALGRLIAKVSTRSWLVDKLRPDELEDLFHASLEPFGGPPPRARRNEVEELSRRVQKAISRKVRRLLEELAPRFTNTDGARFKRAIDQGAIRTAYLLTGDLTSSVDHLRRYDERLMHDLGPETPIGGLLRFAMSADGASFRRRLGTTWG